MLTSAAPVLDLYDSALGPPINRLQQILVVGTYQAPSFLSICGLNKSQNTIYIFSRSKQ